MSTRDKLRAKAKPKIDYVDLDGERIPVRALSGMDRARYSARVSETKDNGGLSVHEIAAFGLCEDDGSLSYDFQNPEDVAELQAFDGAFLERVSLKLFDLSGLTVKSDEDAAKN